MLNADNSPVTGTCEFSDGVSVTGNNLIVDPGSIRQGTLTAGASASGGVWLNEYVRVYGNLTDFPEADKNDPQPFQILAADTESDNKSVRLSLNASGSAYFAGDVGIGTDSPQSPLDVTGSSSDPSLTFDSESVALLGTPQAQLSIGRDSSSPFAFYLQSRKNDNSARDITLNPLGGNVGIGLSDPSSSLHVYDPTASGPDSINSPLLIDNAGTGTNSAHNLGEGPSLGFRVTRSSDGTSTIGAYMKAVAEGDLVNSWPTSLTFGLRRFGSVAEELMRLTSDGKLGIGTENPSTFAGNCKLVVANPGGARIGVGGSNRNFYLEGRRDIDGFTIGSRGSNNTVDLPMVTVLTSGGITFGNDTSTNNALDDYEEGTFTPVVADADTGGNEVPGGDIGVVGSYTKVGNLVTVKVRIANGTYTNLSQPNAFRIRNLPFTSVSDNNNSVAAAEFSYIDLQGSEYVMAKQFVNSNYIRFYGVRDSTALTPILVSSFDGNSQIRLTMTYTAAS